MAVKFGQTATITVSPALVLLIEGMLTEFVEKLSSMDNIVLERESMAMAQQILCRIVQSSMEGEG